MSRASARGSFAPDTSTRRSSSSGRSPGRSSRRRQPSLPGRTPSSEGREKTGAENRRLAAARRADDAEEAGADKAGHELGHEPLPAEEVVGIDRLEARETLERADALRSHAGRGNRARECARLLAHLLKVDHLARQLGLDIAQIAPAGGGTGGDVDEPAARLVDRDRERRPCELAAARVALGRLLRQRPGDHGVERGRQLRPPGARCRRLRFEVREHRPRGPSHAGTAAARRDTRRARSRASTRRPARRSPPRRSARGRRSRWCPGGGRHRRFRSPRRPAS